MTIKGLDKLRKDLKQASAALEEADGDIGSVQFDPHDPGSIERAIVEMELMIDRQFEGDENNPLIAPLMEAMKEQYRQGIIDQAAEARLKGNDGDSDA